MQLTEKLINKAIKQYNLLFLPRLETVQISDIHFSKVYFTITFKDVVGVPNTTRCILNLERVKGTSNPLELLIKVWYGSALRWKAPLKLRATSKNMLYYTN